jgi:hypothetical protein
MTAPTQSSPPAGFYDHEGRQRWWNGTEWTDHYQATTVAPPVQQVNSAGPMTSGKLNVKREVVYNRQQKGHSIIAWVLLACCGIGIPGLIYYSASPNHFWHA